MIAILLVVAVLGWLAWWLAHAEGSRAHKAILDLDRELRRERRKRHAAETRLARYEAEETRAAVDEAARIIGGGA